MFATHNVRVCFGLGYVFNINSLLFVIASFVSLEFDIFNFLYVLAHPYQVSSTCTDAFAIWFLKDIRPDFLVPYWVRKEHLQIIFRCVYNFLLRYSRTSIRNSECKNLLSCLFTFCFACFGETFDTWVVKTCHNARGGIENSRLSSRLTFPRPLASLAGSEIAAPPQDSHK